MRVLSPSMLPFDRSELGSMANTASLPPCSPSTWTPNWSIDVDLPAPGTPLMPTLTDLPLYGRHLSITSWALPTWSGLTLSTSVTAWLSTVTSPFSMPSTISPTDSSRCLRRKRLRYGFTIEGCSTPLLTVSPLYSALFSGCCIAHLVLIFTTTFGLSGSLVIISMRGRECTFDSSSR